MKTARLNVEQLDDRLAPAIILPLSIDLERLIIEPTGGVVTIREHAVNSRFPLFSLDGRQFAEETHKAVDVNDQIAVLPGPAAGDVLLYSRDGLFGTLDLGAFGVPYPLTGFLGDVAVIHNVSALVFDLNLGGRDEVYNGSNVPVVVEQVFLPPTPGGLMWSD